MTQLTRELRIQAGTQADFVTPATPTVALRGITSLTFTPGLEARLLADMTRGLAGGDTSVIDAIAGSAAISGWCSYEHIPYFLDNMFGQAAATGGPAWVRNYAAPILTAPAPRFLSLVEGTALGAYQHIGSLFTDLTLNFRIKREAEFSGNMIGLKMATDTLESLTVPTVTAMHATHLSGFKLDTWAGTMGATTIDNCQIRSAEFTFRPARKLRHCFGGLEATGYVEDEWESTLKIGLLWTSTTKALIDGIVGGTLTQRQIEMTATAGAQSLKLQYAGFVQENPRIFEDDDGAVMVNLTLQKQYHPTFGNWFKAIHTSAIETLT